MNLLEKTRFLERIGAGTDSKPTTTVRARACFALALVSVVLAQTVRSEENVDTAPRTQDPQPMLSNWARQTAASVAEPGTAKHTAALRAALGTAGRHEVGDDGRPKTGSRGVIEASSAERNPQILGVDSDPVYQRWLQHQPAVYSLRNLGLDAMLGRSVNGIYIEDDDGKLADIVALVQKQGRTICSGVLVAPRVVLTAAHCVCLKPDSVYVGRTPRSVSDWQARNDRVFPIDMSGLPNGMSKEDSDCIGPKLYGQDYGVLVLRSPVSPSLAAPVSHVASDHDIMDITPETTLLVVGFGRNPAFNETSGWKNYVEIPVLSPSCAGPGTDQHYGCVPHLELVSALGPYDRSPCQGDSGGAAFVLDPGLGNAENPRRILVGVVSRGVGYLDDSGHATQPVWPVDTASWRSEPTRDATCSGATIFTLVSTEVRSLIKEAKGL